MKQIKTFEEVEKEFEAWRNNYWSYIVVDTIKRKKPKRDTNKDIKPNDTKLHKL